MSNVANHPLRTRVNYLRRVHQNNMTGLQSFELQMLKNVNEMAEQDKERFNLPEFQEAYDNFKHAGQELTALLRDKASEIDAN